MTEDWVLRHVNLVMLLVVLVGILAGGIIGWLTGPLHWVPGTGYVWGA